MLHKAVFLLLCAVSPAGSPARGQQGTTEVLNTDSYWRWDKLYRPPVIAEAYLGEKRPDPSERLTIDGKLMDAAMAEAVREDFPPDWMNPDFDDHLWARTRAAFLRELAYMGLDTSLVCMRGRFQVSDPGGVKSLRLSLTYRGGVVAYLNGREVARTDMPDGPLTPATAATPYPQEIFLDDSGKPYVFPNEYQVGLRIRQGDADLKRRVEGRTRRAEPLEIPPTALRKGVNVLAVAVHRSDYHTSARNWNTNKYAPWLPSELEEIHLTAEGKGISPNVARPEGFQVWNMDRNDRTSVLDYGEPSEPLRPIRLSGARNGAYSGKVVLSSTGPIGDLRAEADALKRLDGRAAVPASAVQVRYALPDGQSRPYAPWFDALNELPPGQVGVDQAGGGAVQPIWVTVHVPREAAPGEYRGTLTVSAEGVPPVRVPLELRVADWTVPALVRSRSYAGVYQSPTTLALKYDVKLWSEPHWRLMEKSFELLGQLGADIVNIPLSEHTQFGNDEGMVLWVRKSDRTFEYDFTVFDRYMNLVQKHLVDPDFIVLHLWHAAGWEDRGVKQENTVTVIDPATGARESMQVPEFGTEASKTFWAPVLSAIRERLARLGLAEKLCLGALSDGTAPPQVFTVFNEILPETRWARFSHVQTRSDKPMPLRGGGRIALQEHVYDLSLADPAKPLPPIWDTARRPGAAFFRSEFDHALSLLGYRTEAERALFCSKRGFGRVCLDFWAVPGGTKHGDLNNRWPISSVAQRSPVMLHLAAAGPEGAIPTVRFEALREGIQDAEALIVVAEALDKHADALGPQLAARCRKLLLDRLAYCHRRNVIQWQKVFFHINHRGWQELTARLYDLAGEAERAVADRAAAK